MWPHDIVRDSHSHRCSTVSLPLRHLYKGFMSFPILCKLSYRPRSPVSRPTTMDSYCLLMPSSLVATLLCRGLSLSALECLQSLLDFQHSMCFLSIPSTITKRQTKYGLGSSKWSVSILLNQFVSPLIAQDALMPRLTHQLNRIVCCYFVEASQALGEHLKQHRSIDYNSVA